MYDSLAEMDADIAMMNHIEWCDANCPPEEPDTAWIEKENRLAYETWRDDMLADDPDLTEADVTEDDYVDYLLAGLE